MTTSVIVSYDKKTGSDAILLVGRINKKQDIEVVNAFQGEEAEELYKKLITVKVAPSTINVKR